MIRPRHTLTLMLATLLGACSSPLIMRDNEPTIGELERPALLPVPDVAPKQRRETAMRHYQDFLNESPDTVFVPEAMRRLADLHLSSEQDALMAGTPLHAEGKSRAAELYAELLERYPDHQHSGTALYQLARAHEQSGELEPSMQALTDYASRHPDGAEYDEAQFRLAEHFFVNGDYRQAAHAYQAVLALSPESNFHSQALYKLGWARFKQQDYTGAVHAHLQLLDRDISDHNSAALPSGLERADQERLDDALRAVSLSFVYLGDAQAIQGYFRTHGARNYEPLIYAKLAALHLSKERYTDTADTYRMFAQEHPLHPEAPLFQSRVIDVFKQAGFSAQLLEEKQAFVERYQPSSDYWIQQDPARESEVLEQVQRHLRDVAQHYHAEAQRLKTPVAFNQADRWYLLYLDAFASSEQAPTMNFLYAELLTSAGRHDQAAAQYSRTAYDYGAHDKAAEAGYATLLAYARHEATLKGEARLKWHRAGIASALLFADQFPAHEQALPARMRAAEQLYTLQDYANASVAAQHVVDNPAASADLQLAAWTVIAHAQFDLQDYQRAESAYQQVLARHAAKDDARAKLEEKLAASIYKQGEQARGAGDAAAAAEHYLRIARVVPASPINVTAQYDAAVAYISLSQWPQAIGILESWRERYPAHDLQSDVTRKLAVLYQENAQPLQAASEFTRIAGSETDPALRREAAWTAAGLYQQAGNASQAIAAYQDFVAQFPQPVEQAMEARQHLVTLYAADGNRARQLHWQEQLVHADRSAGSQRSDRTRFLAAHAQLALVERDLESYQAVRLAEPLKKNLALKKQHMQATIQGFQAAAAYEIGAVTTEATFRTAELYADFGKALLASERPRNLNAEELEQYGILLEEQAYPFEEKAIEVHEANAQRIGNGLYDDWVQKSMTALAELLPARYAKEEESEKFIARLH